MNENDYRDLVERSHMIEQLTQHPGWAFFVDRAHVSMIALQNSILAGKYERLDDYRYDAGRLRGSHGVLNVPATVAEEVQTARKLLEEQQAANEE